MSAAISPSTNARYGVERVCRVWEQPRSTYYLKTTRVVKVASTTPKLKRGPKTVISDEELLGAIQKEIESSPSKGNSYMRIYDSLHFGPQKLRVGKSRVLRLMRKYELFTTSQVTGRVYTDADTD